MAEIRVRHQEMCEREGGLETLYLPLPAQGKKRGGQQKKRFKTFKERFLYNKRLKKMVVRIKRHDGQVEPNSKPQFLAYFPTFPSFET